MAEAQLASDLHGVLEKVPQGLQVVIEQNSRPVAVLKAPELKGRLISEVIADLKTRGSDAIIDDDFADDIDEGIKTHREPWNPPSWE